MRIYARIFALILILALILSGCTHNPSSESSVPEPAESSQAAESSAPEESSEPEPVIEPDILLDPLDYPADRYEVENLEHITVVDSKAMFRIILKEINHRTDNVEFVFRVVSHLSNGAVIDFPFAINGVMIPVESNRHQLFIGTVDSFSVLIPIKDLHAMGIYEINRLDFWITVSQKNYENVLLKDKEHITVQISEPSGTEYKTPALLTQPGQETDELAIYPYDLSEHPELAEVGIGRTGWIIENKTDQFMTLRCRERRINEKDFEDETIELYPGQINMVDLFNWDATMIPISAEMPEGIYHLSGQFAVTGSSGNELYREDYAYVREPDPVDENAPVLLSEMYQPEGEYMHHDPKGLDILLKSCYQVGNYIMVQMEVTNNTFDVHNSIDYSVDINGIHLPGRTTLLNFSIKSLRNQESMEYTHMIPVDLLQRMGIDKLESINYHFRVTLQGKTGKSYDYTLVLPGCEEVPPLNDPENIPDTWTTFLNSPMFSLYYRDCGWSGNYDTYTLLFLCLNKTDATIYLFGGQFSLDGAPIMGHFENILVSKDIPTTFSLTWSGAELAAAGMPVNKGWTMEGRIALDKTTYTTPPDLSELPAFSIPIG
ncbi:MAG: hypothetical protein IJM90_04530 [Firmicutes bacterium]|nr:hypothetical protein [Bacillota bacterium]